MFGIVVTLKKVVAHIEKYFYSLDMLLQLYGAVVVRSGGDKKTGIRTLPKPLECFTNFSSHVLADHDMTSCFEGR